MRRREVLDETKANNQVDLFWASAPDAFEVLKKRSCCRPTSQGRAFPEKVGQSYPINDPDGFYFGFAASGYGIMWNERYAKANKLPDPKEWQDLAKPVFHDHVSIASPARSGTTHLTIETILQGEGWDKGWGTIKAMAGNFNQITERSFGVPDAVNSGQVGVGIVIDFFAFSAQGAGLPGQVRLSERDDRRAGQYRHRGQCAEQGGRPRPSSSSCCRRAGQEVLLEPTIRRLPVNPAIYAKAPAGFPQSVHRQALHRHDQIRCRQVGEAHGWSIRCSTR
jgi:phosphoglycerate transport regulatory protein PgtC